MISNCIKRCFNGYGISRIMLVCVFVFLVFFMQSIPASGQIFPYLPFFQQYLPSLSNLFINPYAAANPYYSLNPYLGLLNQSPLFNNPFSLNTSSLYPQASVAGGLIPFTGFNLNPFGLPYIPAATYFAAALTPVDVAGAWAGVWVSTFLPGGVTTGDLSITLAQSGTDVTGTVAFFLNKILKFGADVVGTVEGNILTLTSTVLTVGGTKTFDVTISATVNGIEMDGTYLAINNVTASIAEEGTFTATRL
ncbi:MAG: hypothetical protein ACMUIU_06000 [bacterium]